MRQVLHLFSQAQISGFNKHTSLHYKSHLLQKMEGLLNQSFKDGDAPIPFLTNIRAVHHHRKNLEFQKNALQATIIKKRKKWL
jgi:hypothetical protein